MNPEPILVTYVCKSLARPKLASLTLQIHVNPDGKVVAAGTPDRQCFAANFIGDTWRLLRAQLEADHWTIEELDR